MEDLSDNCEYRLQHEISLAPETAQALLYWLLFNAAETKTWLIPLNIRHFYSTGSSRGQSPYVGRFLITLIGTTETALNAVRSSYPRYSMSMERISRFFILPDLLSCLYDV